MILDYYPATGAYTLRIKRGEADPREIMKEHGLDFSLKNSTAGEAMMFTRNPYAAAVFSECATPQAYMELGHVITEIKSSWNPQGMAHIKVPADCELSGYQIADIEYALRRDNTLIGDQPGLGKTPTAIAFCNEINAKRVLVICPANIRHQWEREIRKWSTMRWPFVVYPILASKRGVHPVAQWTIVSYDLAREPNIGAALAQGTYDVIILDEAHFLKTADSLRTQAIFGGGGRVLFEPLASRAGGILALTGTPLPNRPREAYTIARALDWSSIDWISEDTFKSRFNPSVKMQGIKRDKDGLAIHGTEYTYTIEKAGRHGELQNRLRSHFMVRHLKADVLPQLKLPIYDIVLVEENEAIKAALNAERLLDIDPDNPTVFKHTKNNPGDGLGATAAARHMMGIALAPRASEYIETILAGGEEKLFVVGWHIEVLNILERKLGRHGFIRIDGNVSPTKRQKLVDEFQSDPRKRICLGNILAVGTGTDGLQNVCSHVVSVEASWVAGQNEQFVDRLHRRGQTRTVLADFIVAPGSISERVLTSSLKKLNETDKVLDRRIIV